VAESKAAVRRWARGQRNAAQRIARDTRRKRPNLGEALARVEDLRRFADGLRATRLATPAERENLRFHLIWRRLRRASGFG
jgi:hypothetical protein